MDVSLSFGEWLDDQLKRRRWTQAAFAEAVGVARPTVNGWINGTPPRRRSVIRDIARVLEVDINEVLVRAQQPPLDPGYQLPEDRVAPEGVRPIIDLNDPLVEVSAANADKLTPEQKQILAELIRTMVREQPSG